MKRLFEILLLLVLCNMAHAVTLDEVQLRFGQQNVVRAQFEQQRSIAGIQRPLRSSGSMLVARDNGLWWHQQHPFAMTLVMNDQRMVQTTGKQSPQIITAQDNPQLFQFNALLVALFRADQVVLEQNFATAFSDLGEDHWRLILTPKASPLDKLFNSITLQGSEYLDSIILDDKQGDRTQIQFSEHDSNPDLSDEEKQRFAM